MKKRQGRYEFSLFVLRTLVIWLSLIAWWECLFSAFPEMTADRRYLYGISFVMTVFIHLCFVCRYSKAAVSGLILGEIFILWRYFHIVKAVAACLVNAFLTAHQRRGYDVRLWEEVPLSSLSLSAGMAVFVCGPLIFVLLAVIRSGKGKILSGVIFFFPILAAILEGIFPSAISAWMLILAAGSYLSVCAAGGKGAEKISGAAWTGAAASVAFLLVLGAVSVLAGRALDVLRQEDDGVYLRTRSSIQAGIVDNLDNIRRQMEGQGEEEEETKGPEEEQIPREQTSQEETPEEDSGNFQPQEGLAADTSETAGNDSNVSASDDVGPAGMTDLSTVSRFAPQEGTQIVVQIEDPPDGTVYYPLRYGGVYTGRTWEETDSADGGRSIFLSYPDDLGRLEDLCASLKADTVDEAEEQIDREVTETAVYDTDPGAAPADEDFAEYFLFENRKGFCVHFATTAALMYRMMGYPSRYAEGYAIPASAFSRQGDGTYSAVADGTMGHAWCETYADGVWTVREHTPSSGITGSQGWDPAGGRENRLKETVLHFVRIAAVVLAVPVCAAAAIFLQAAFRRKKRYQSLKNKDRAKAVQAVYLDIYEKAVFMGMKETDPLKEETCRQIAAVWDTVSDEEIAWLYQRVMESAFYNKEPDREQYASAWKIYKKVKAAVEGKLTGWQKWKYRYVKCM